MGWPITHSLTFSAFLISDLLRSIQNVADCSGIPPVQGDVHDGLMHTEK